MGLTAPVSHRRDRELARQAEDAGRAILAACRGSIRAHEIVTAYPSDVADGKPLVSLLLHGMGVEAHAYFASRIYADLAEQLAAAGAQKRGETRSTLLRLAGVIEQI